MIDAGNFHLPKYFDQVDSNWPPITQMSIFMFKRHNQGFKQIVFVQIFG